MGFSRQEYWSALPFPSPGDLPPPGIEPASLKSPHWWAGSLPLVPPGKPIVLGIFEVKVANGYIIAVRLHIPLPQPFLSTALKWLPCALCPGFIEAFGSVCSPHALSLLWSPSRAPSWEGRLAALMLREHQVTLASLLLKSTWCQNSWIHLIRTWHSLQGVAGSLCARGQRRPGLGWRALGKSETCQETVTRAWTPGSVLWQGIPQACSVISSPGRGRV